MGLKYDPATRQYGIIELEFRAAPIGDSVDGDTCDVAIDMGINNLRHERLRLLGINTPEIHDPDPTVRAAALKAKLRLTALLSMDSTSKWPLRITTVKDDSFGRYLANIYYTDAHGIEQNINAIMLAEGLAVPYKRK